MGRLFLILGDSDIGMKTGIQESGVKNEKIVLSWIKERVSVGSRTETESKMRGRRNAVMKQML